MKHAYSLFAICAVLAGLSTLAQAQAPYTSATRYNVAGQVTGTMAPDPDDGGPLGFPATRNTYGLEGTPTAGLLTQTEVGQLTQWDVWSSFTAFQTRTFAYDNQGRKISERVIGKDDVTTESLVQYSYDSWDRVDCKVVRMDPAAFPSPEPNACQLGSQGSFGPDRITKFTYDGWDQVLTETRALQAPLVQTYVTNEGRSSAKPEVALWQENIRLIEAASEEEVRAAGARLAKSGEHSYEADGTRFTWTFKSVLGTYLIEGFNLESGLEIFSRFLKKVEAESLLTSFD